MAANRHLTTSRGAFRRLLLASVVLGACATKAGTGEPASSPPIPITASGAGAATPAEASAAIDPEHVREHVAFLADDALAGRAPGTTHDEQTQTYVETYLRKLGLEPAFADGFRQPFEVTDGVRLVEGASSQLTVGKTSIAHAVVPFAGNGEATGKLVFVGHGIAEEGKGTGDFAGLEKKLAGAIVVALEGPPPNNPHLSPMHARPQQKLINARDLGAAGFILWEPKGTTAWPNHGEASDLKIPAVWVGAEGSDALLAAFGGKRTKDGDIDLKPGARGRGKATIASPVEPVVKRTANVAARLPGNGKSDRVLVVGAHMDHLGMGTSSSLAMGEHAVHNGADDNASGVGVVLELARALAATEPEHRPFDIVFIAFGAEEMGLIGSKRYVEALGDAASKRIAAMLNFDMVGRLGDDGLVVAGSGTAKEWPELITGHAGSLKVQMTEDGYGPSDHGSFYEAGVPVLHFFTGSHSDYHKPSDDIDKINFEGAARVGNLALKIVDSLESDQVEPSYIKVARKQATRGGFRVSLGTIPDYGANVDGVRLSGVREGGPAAASGMQKGDVIVSMAGREVHNLDDYMASFAVLEPNEEIDIEVMRDGKKVPLKLTPAPPSTRR